jgi:hypothetical protein
VFLREYRNGLYSAVSFYAALILVRCALQAIFTVIFCTVLYFMVGCSEFWLCTQSLSNSVSGVLSYSIEDQCFTACSSPFFCFSRVLVHLLCSTRVGWPCFGRHCVLHLPRGTLACGLHCGSDRITVRLSDPQRSLGHCAGSDHHDAVGALLWIPDRSRFVAPHEQVSLCAEGSYMICSLYLVCVCVCVCVCGCVCARNHPTD